MYTIFLPHELINNIVYILLQNLTFFTVFDTIYAKKEFIMLLLIQVAPSKYIYLYTDLF